MQIIIMHIFNIIKFKIKKKKTFYEYPIIPGSKNLKVTWHNFLQDSTFHARHTRFVGVPKTIPFPIYISLRIISYLSETYIFENVVQQ